MTIFTIIHTTPASMKSYDGRYEENYITHEAQTEINITRVIERAAYFWMAGIKQAGHAKNTFVLINGRSPEDYPYNQDVDINDYLEDDDRLTEKEKADYEILVAIVTARIENWTAEKKAAEDAERERLANLAVEKARKITQLQREKDEADFEMLRRKLGK